ncbi:hypothetical protein [Marinifilum fragile]|uniref:hypothetical protein n=1 Tax=Marinifilum fragile TaxID=570161 RepID=UPI002AA6D2F1|nr:hypothetical protein [Marinifilum fragile]
MKARIYTLLFLIGLLSMQSCSKSALSDIELTDPSLLKVSVRIAQDYNNNKEVQVFIRDKNSRPVQLENGWVEVNGIVAHWSRADIHSLSERGYIYRPDEYEHDFRIYIHLNPYDVYWFDLNPSTGFPGFIRNYPLHDDEFHPEYDPYIDDHYNLYDMPFRNEIVKVNYKILKPR